jgi:iron complex transport system substrate-binding protein
MGAQIDAIAAAASAGSAPRTYYELDFFEGASYAPAPGSFVADMVRLAGGLPITTADPAAFQMPTERLVEADPEIIVLGDAMFGHCPDTVAARPGWADMTAVANGDVRPVDGELVTLPAPRLPQGLASLARAIHPDLELAGFPPDAPMCEAG